MAYSGQHTISPTVDHYHIQWTPYYITYSGHYTLSPTVVSGHQRGADQKIFISFLKQNHISLLIFKNLNCANHPTGSCLMLTDLELRTSRRFSYLLKRHMIMFKILPKNFMANSLSFLASEECDLRNAFFKEQ